MIGQKVWTATAPANIALIKYMGKRDDGVNTPLNDSLSYTLDNCLTKVELTLKENIEEGDSWDVLRDEDYPYLPQLDEQDQQRFIRHLCRIKKHYNVENHAFHIRSANNFPASCGIASSASSFAALTHCAAQALAELTNKTLPTIAELAALSRLGSGSSCRSFYSPWAYWQADDNNVRTVSLPYKKLLHNVLIVSVDQKTISSSLAHQLVTSSPLFENRLARVQQRIKDLQQAFTNCNWLQIYAIVHAEWQDMHELFHTCAQPFHYIKPATKQIVSYFEKHWSQYGDGPLITLDAGPNVHALFREDQHDMQQRCLSDMAEMNIKYL